MLQREKIVYIPGHDRFLVDRVASLEARLANVESDVQADGDFNDGCSEILEARVAGLERELNNKAAGSELADFAGSVCRAGEEQAHSIAHLEARVGCLEAGAAEMDEDCGPDWWRGLRQMGDQIRARALEERESRVVRLGISAALGQTGLSTERRVANRRGPQRGFPTTRRKDDR